MLYAMSENQFIVLEIFFSAWNQVELPPPRWRSLHDYKTYFLVISPPTPNKKSSIVLKFMALF
jgi:hypothetical protein